MTDFKTPVAVADYLFTRLHQLGVRSVHGVPGDFNLVMLDHVTKCNLNWVGNCNELNAAYAADGYARVNGLSALITTFGVGELSALNGIAGAYSEMIPLVHIVGCPSTVSQRHHALLHHTLGNGDFHVFADMSRHITCAFAELSDTTRIPGQIDSVLQACMRQKRPVYIMVPTDIVHATVEGASLDSELDTVQVANDKEKEDFVVKRVLERVYAAKNPAVIVDACAVRYGVLNQVREFLDKTKFPVFVTPMGKGSVHEDYPQFAGVYAGVGSSPGAQDRFENSDLIISMGALLSDFNTTGFTSKTFPLKTIEFHSTYTSIQYATYPGLGFSGVLRAVLSALDPSKLTSNPSTSGPAPLSDPKSIVKSDTITHDWLWPNLGSFLRERDILVTETGTANFGVLGTKFPHGIIPINQILWGSIGYSVGAAHGAAVAAKDEAQSGSGQEERRTILFVGDGSFQLTAQEVSTMIRNKLKVIIFLINNNGYTIERLIHGVKASYNDIQPWQYTSLPEAFGGVDGKTTKTYRVETRSELLQLFSDKEFGTSDKVQFVELFMPWDDAPETLKVAAKAAGKNVEA